MPGTQIESLSEDLGTTKKVLDQFLPVKSPVGSAQPVSSLSSQYFYIGDQPYQGTITSDYIGDGTTENGYKRYKLDPSKKPPTPTPAVPVAAQPTPAPVAGTVAAQPTTVVPIAGAAGAGAMAAAKTEVPPAKVEETKPGYDKNLKIGASIAGIFIFYFMIVWALYLMNSLGLFAKSLTTGSDFLLAIPITLAFIGLAMMVAYTAF